MNKHQPNSLIALNPEWHWQDFTYRVSAANLQEITGPPCLMQKFFALYSDVLDF